MNQNYNLKSLKGKEVYNRTMELMNKLTPINESIVNSSIEFIKRGPDKITYLIIRENRKFFIKNTKNTKFKISELDYSGGLKNKLSEAYGSYEDALKHLNMKFQQLNEMYGIKGGHNLFEQDKYEVENELDEEKKYKLKLKSDNEVPSEPSFTPSSDSPEVPSVEDVPSSPEVPSVEDVPSSPEDGESTGKPTGEEGMGEPTGEEGMGDETDDDIDVEDEDEDPKKYIQKLTGKLGQKLRELQEIDPKLDKYVMNSIISAIHVDKMDKKDRSDIIKKFKKRGKGMDSTMLESFDQDENFGRMSLKGPFNFEKLGNHSMDEDEGDNYTEFDEFDVPMDEKLIGKQRRLDKNRNNQIDAEDLRILRSIRNSKKSSDEHLDFMDDYSPEEEEDDDQKHVKTIDPDIDEPLSPPRPKRPSPFTPPIPDYQPKPKAKKFDLDSFELNENKRKTKK